MENKPRVLVVDDKESIRQVLRVALGAQAFTVFEAASGREAISVAVAQRPDAVILDLGLPDMDGVAVIRELRRWKPTPIIILSVRGSEDDKIAALDAGADDYVTKPFSILELLARLRAALRRVSQPADNLTFTGGVLCVDFTSRIVSVAGHEVRLTRNEYDLLRVFVSNAGKVLTQRQLLHDVWGPGYEGEIHLLQVNISNLRGKIEPEPDHPRLIVSEPGVGYRLKVD
jgi:two-component system KDP operon response regulator KdpE